MLINLNHFFRSSSRGCPTNVQLGCISLQKICRTSFNGLGLGNGFEIEASCNRPGIDSSHVSNGLKLSIGYPPLPRFYFFYF